MSDDPLHIWRSSFLGVVVWFFFWFLSCLPLSQSLQTLFSPPRMVHHCLYFWKGTFTCLPTPTWLHLSRKMRCLLPIWYFCSLYDAREDINVDMFLSIINGFSSNLKCVVGPTWGWGWERFQGLPGIFLSAKKSATIIFLSFWYESKSLMVNNLFRSIHSRFNGLINSDLSESWWTCLI